MFSVKSGLKPIFYPVRLLVHNIRGVVRNVRTTYFRETDTYTTITFIRNVRSFGKRIVGGGGREENVFLSTYPAYINVPLHICEWGGDSGKREGDGLKRGIPNLLGRPLFLITINV